MICIFDCDEEEAVAFGAAAERLGARIMVVLRELDAHGAQRLPAGCVVSINHRSIADAHVLHALSTRNVRYLNTRSVGTNHIDMAQARLAGIKVEGVRYSPESVAEHAVLLMLMAVRNMAPALQRARDGDYRLAKRRAETVQGMTVGIVGTGRIGQSVAQRLRGFGCNLLGYAPAPCAAMRYVPLGELIAQSDVVTLHLPLTEETRHLMNRERIFAMKQGAILVNTARGGLVDSRALAQALACGHLSGAALDVVEGEEGWFYHDCTGRQAAPFEELRRMPNVVMTPHTAFYTRQALLDIVENTLRNCMKHEGMLKRWVV